MAPLKEMNCWEIMHCDGSKDCPARLQPEKPCWEIVREIEDYRAEFNICKDCLVYVVKNGECALTRAEINAITRTKRVCLLARKIDSPEKANHI